MEIDTQGTVAAAKRCYSILGMALLATAGITVLVQFALGMATELWNTMGLEFASSSWFFWLVSFAPLYLIGVPVGLLIFRCVPGVAQKKVKLGGKNFWVLLLMCFPMMCFGNLIGTLLSMLLSGGNAQNGLLDYAMDTSWLKIIVMVIVAPLVEEYVFRKKMIDRCARYGEKVAIFSQLLHLAYFT